MTKDEYISVCLKYSDYLDMTDIDDSFIKGAELFTNTKVSTIVYEDNIVDSDKVIGKIFYKCCYSQDKKIIETTTKFCYAHTKEDFEKYIQIFIKNYKKVKVKLKKYEIEKDFK